MSDVYDIWLYPLQDWWRTVNEMADFMSIGQMGNFIFRPVHHLQIACYGPATAWVRGYKLYVVYVWQSSQHVSKHA